MQIWDVGSVRQDAPEIDEYVSFIMSLISSRSLWASLLSLTFVIVMTPELRIVTSLGPFIYVRNPPSFEYEEFGIAAWRYWRISSSLRSALATILILDSSARHGSTRSI